MISPRKSSAATRTEVGDTRCCKPLTIGNVLVALALAVLIVLHWQGNRQTWGENVRLAGPKPGGGKAANVQLRQLAPSQTQQQGLENGTQAYSSGKPTEWYADLPVDFVFAWYNHTDPKRKEVWERLKPKGTVYGTEPNRGEVFLSIASVHKYAPWVQRIFVVTPPGQQLRLDLFEPELRAKIKLVSEDKFIPAKFLPTFSSMVVEAFLHLIPGVSEHFVYMNDDMMLGHAFPKSLVFSRTPGVMSVFMLDWRLMLSHRPSSEGWQETWKWPFYNAAVLMWKTFKVRLQWGWHAGYLLSRSGYKATWALFGRELNQTVSHPFRTYKPVPQGGDVVPHLLVQSVAMHLGLQEVVPAYQVAWKNNNEIRNQTIAARVSYAHNAATDLEGLPAGLFEVQPADRGVTFVNFNKLQHMRNDAFVRWCSSVVDILQSAFDAKHHHCLCSKAEVGRAC